VLGGLKEGEGEKTGSMPAWRGNRMGRHGQISCLVEEQKENQFLIDFKIKIGLQNE
jgi:hypothetical protein